MPTAEEKVANILGFRVREVTGDCVPVITKPDGSNWSKEVDYRMVELFNFAVELQSRLDEIVRFCEENKHHCQPLCNGVIARALTQKGKPSDPSKEMEGAKP